MTHLNQLNRWARTPKPNDAGAWAQSAVMLNQVAEAERRKDQADRQHGRAADQSGCVQIEFGFLQSLEVRDGAD
ncbi:MAG: hypothetical protein OXI94_08315 [Gemmatimonadota bacterium]|nr:hypothetical protein [Gemmatimonadota bacterium]